MKKLLSVFSLCLLAGAENAGSAAAAPLPPGMVVGSVSKPLTAADGSNYLIFLPPNWTASDDTSSDSPLHPVLLFLHGVGGINNADGCRNPGLTTQFPLLDPEYAGEVNHIVIVPVAKQPNWRHHFKSSMALVDMALSTLGGDPERVAIAGQSMGAHGAYLFASQLAPGRFCAIVVMCGYLDEGRTIAGPLDEVPSAVVGPLKSTPIWIFHSEKDSSVPPPGQGQDESTMVIKALEAAGNSAVRYTRYPLGAKPPNYIPGHAAFEFGFHDEGLWPWLAAQKQAQKRTNDDSAALPPGALLGGGLMALVMLLTFLRLQSGAGRLKFLAKAISTVALVVSSIAFLGLMQSEGGLLDSCYSYSFVDVSVEKCRAIGAAIVAAGEAEKGWLALAISKARAENCFALGMGIGAAYALLFLTKGTKDVAVVHLMHAGWATSVCAANAQNAGLLQGVLAPAEANIDPLSSARLVPFVFIVGVQAFLDLCAWALSSGHDKQDTDKKSDTNTNTKKKKKI